MGLSVQDGLIERLARDHFRQQIPVHVRLRASQERGHRAVLNVHRPALQVGRVVAVVALLSALLLLLLLLLLVLVGLLER